MRAAADELLVGCSPHAQELGCASELEGICALAEQTGAARQLGQVRQLGSLPRLISALADDFT